MRRGVTKGEPEHGCKDRPPAAVPATEHSHRPGTDQLLSLQRCIGNRATSRLIAQAKLDIGPAGDSFEREADRVANLVVTNLWNRGSRPTSEHQTEPGDSDQEEPTAALPGGGTLQRTAGTNEGIISPKVEKQAPRWNDRSTRHAAPATRYRLTPKTASERPSAASTSAAFAFTPAPKRATSTAR